MSVYPRVTATAHPNIALVKYWGKRHTGLNLPAAGSISLTLDGLHTTTSVQFSPDLDADQIHLNDALLPQKPAARLSAFLDIVRQRAGIEHRAQVHTQNDFPTSAGLASSASGFAALATAATHAAGLDLQPRELSILARKGSGSAARSIFGGWVEMLPGSQENGSGEDSYALQLHDQSYWDLRCLVAVCAQGPKKIGSTEAMLNTAHTSPYYDAWIEDVPRAIAEAKNALQNKDFQQLAEVSEASCLRMHACAMGANPGILYWKGITVELIHFVRTLRAAGTPVFFTIDAGPHIKAFCTPEAEEAVANALREVPGVLDILHTRGGAGARIQQASD